MGGVMPPTRQAEKSRRTRERVLSSTVQLIREQGLSSASPVRIAQHTGLSWGAVQHHFGSKEQLLRAIAAASSDGFVAAVTTPDYAGLDLPERVSAFVDAAWAHYHGDLFLASVEIAFWHRNNNIPFVDKIVGEDGRPEPPVVAAVGRIFAGMGFAADMLVEATFHMHCALTGLAFQEILAGGKMQVAPHLLRCKRAVETIIRSADSD